MMFSQQLNSPDHPIHWWQACLYRLQIWLAFCPQLVHMCALGVFPRIPTPTKAWIVVYGVSWELSSTIRKASQKSCKSIVCQWQVIPWGWIHVWWSMCILDAVKVACVLGEHYNQLNSVPPEFWMSSQCVNEQYLNECLENRRCCEGWECDTFRAHILLRKVG